MKQERGSDFARLVYTILVIEKRWRLDEVAAAMGLKYDTLYSRVSGRVAFSADEIRALLRCAPDPRLANYVLRDSPFIAIDRVIADELQDNKNIHFGATHSVLQVAEVLRAVEQALDDDRLDHRERAEVMRSIDQAERSLASLRHRITAGTE
jgi:hypothetical protein